MMRLGRHFLFCFQNAEKGQHFSSSLLMIQRNDCGSQGRPMRTLVVIPAENTGKEPRLSLYGPKDISLRKRIVSQAQNLSFPLSFFLSFSAIIWKGF